jgi:cell division protease FtsH
MPLAMGLDLKEIAASTPGLVGADLRNLVNEAALLAARRNQESIHHKDVLDALETQVLGPARTLVMSVEERTRVAYHEGGHAILGLLVPGADPVNRVTIVPHGMALGVTYQRPEDDRHSYSEQYLHARIVGAMGGRAAEEVVFGTHTTGAENDMQQATELARQMVTRWGMSERLGPVTLAPRDGTSGGGPDGFGFGGKPYGSATADAVDAEVCGSWRKARAGDTLAPGARRAGWIGRGTARTRDPGRTCDPSRDGPAVIPPCTSTAARDRRQQQAT